MNQPTNNVYVRFIKDNRERNVFLSVIPLENATTDGYIYSYIWKLLKRTREMWNSGFAVFQ
jgi:hypothetical protein